MREKVAHRRSYGLKVGVLFKEESLHLLSRGSVAKGRLKWKIRVGETPECLEKLDPGIL